MSARSGAVSYLNVLGRPAHNLVRTRTGLADQRKIEEPLGYHKTGGTR